MTTATRTTAANTASAAKPSAAPAILKVQPYLFFNGRCEEAIAFYGKALGAKVERLMRVKDSPDPPPPGMYPPGSENLVMHACLTVGEGLVLMASDGCGGGAPRFEGVTLSLTVASEAEARRVFDALAEGGAVQMPLGKTFFSPCFGMATDRFGMAWMVIVEA